MKGFTFLAIIGLAVGAQASPIVFFGGEWNGITGSPSQINGPTFVDSQTYDNFSLASETQIDGIFANFLDTGSVRGSTLAWEIRTGVADNDPGTLLFGGNDVATAVLSGTPLTNIEFTYSCAASPFILAAGDYFLSVAVDGGNGDIFASTTSGINGVGGPLADDNSFYNAPSLGANFAVASNFVGAPADFSFGLRGAEPTPEPASFAILGLGALVLLRRRRI
jgi:MYXO-CTERM domain-containing protein